MRGLTKPSNCTEAHVPSLRYGQYLMHAHNHITRAVASTDSWFALIGIHQLGIANWKQPIGSSEFLIF